MKTCTDDALIQRKRLDYIWWQNNLGFPIRILL